MRENPTRRLSPHDTKHFDAHWGTATLHANVRIKITIEGMSEPLVFRMEQGIVFGRLRVGDTTRPNVDLTGFNAAEKGVSRIHASLDVVGKHLMITDMGSSNGTFLNGQRVAAKQQRVVRDRDEIRLGELVMYVSLT